LILYRQIERGKKNLTRFDQQRNRDAETLRTVTDNLQRAFYTNDSIGTDMKRETEKLKKEEDGMRVKSFISFKFYILKYSFTSQQWKEPVVKFMKNLQ
jgi:hypothetical protein